MLGTSSSLAWFGAWCVQSRAVVVQKIWRIYFYNMVSGSEDWL